jgi:hypothetical protein
VRIACLAAALLASACGSGSDSGDCGPGLVSEASQCLTPPTQPLSDQGGNVLPAMEVWTVVFAGDEDLGTSVDTLNGLVLASSYYTGGLAEYGVGAGTAHGVIIAGAPPAAVNDPFYDAQIGQLVGRVSSSGETLHLGPNTVLTFVIPKATSEPVGTSYHTTTAASFPLTTGGSAPVPYIVLRQDSVGFVADFDYLTWTETHELVETATDPGTPDAWLDPELDLLGEIADLCNDIPVQLSLGGTTYMLTRYYSARLAAARLGDPCVPALNVPYVNVAISPLQLGIPSGIGKTGTVHLNAYALGATTTVSWRLFADTGYNASPSSGTLSPGQSADVTIRRTGTPQDDPAILILFVNDTSSPTASIPRAESFGAVITE